MVIGWRSYADGVGRAGWTGLDLRLQWSVVSVVGVSGRRTAFSWLAWLTFETARLAGAIVLARSGTGCIIAAHSATRESSACLPH